MKSLKLSSWLPLCLLAHQAAVSAPEYISNFSSFPAYPYNTTAYKQGGAFVGCGPTTGAMMLGYFQTVYSLSNLLTSPGTGVDKGLNTAWALHGASYMKTLATGFGNVYDIKPGLENYAAAKGYTLKVLIHVSPTYTSPNATFDTYGPYGNAWTNDASFFQQKGDGTWKIDPAAFCNFLEPKLDAGIPIFLTIDSDGDGGGDHWVALVGFDRATGKYAFYDTYDTTLKWADIYYVLDSSGHKVNSISYVRTVELSLPDIASNPAAWNYGSVVLGAYSDKTFVVSNTGTAALNVTAATLTGTHASEFGIQSGGGAFSLAAGATRNIVVRFSPGAAGARSASLNLTSNDPDENPFAISLSGTGAAGAPDIASNLTSYSYASLNVGSAREFIFIISNTGGSNLNVTATTLTGANASEFIIPSGGGAFTLAPGATRNLVVRFVPASAGNKAASLSIASNDPDENPFLIALNGKGIAPDITSDPTSQNYGTILIGESLEKTFSVYNLGSATLNVTGVTLTGANASEFSIQSGAGAFTQAVGATPRKIVVRFTPAGAGGKTASLSIACDDPDENPYLISLSGTGTTIPPDIASNPTSWNYNSVNLGAYSDKTLIISNPGTANLNVTSVTLTGTNASEFSIQSGGGAFSLAAGEKRNVTARFAPSTAGMKSASLNFASNDPDENPFLVGLSGIGGPAPDIASNSTSYSYGSVNVGSAKENIFVISNTGNADLNVTATTITGVSGVTGSEFIIPSGGAPFTLTPGATRNLVVRFIPNSEGNKTARLSIESNDPDENPFLITLVSNGTAPDIASNPASGDFGSRTVGGWQEKTFSISNTGSAELIVTAVTLTGTNASDFSIQSGGGAFTLAVGSATRNIVVRFTPASAGGKNASLSIASNDPDENPFLVGLSGTGTPASVPDIAVDPASWDFGSVSLGGYSEKTLVVSNAGTGDLNVTTAALTGTHASNFGIQSGGGAFTLAPGATRNIVVRFTPASAGGQSASLSIASNDPDENPFLVGLSGTGTPASVPDIAVDPASWDFGSVSLGAHSEKTFIVSNTGNGILSVSSVALTGANASDFGIESGGGAFTLAPAATREIKVLFSPADAGTKVASLNFRSNDPNEDPFEVTLAGTGLAGPSQFSKRVLWDMTHGLYGNYQPSGRYGELAAALRNEGYEVDTTTHFQNEDLSPFGVVVVCLGSAWKSPYTAGEIAKIRSFVENGGGLMLLADNPGTPYGNIAPMAQAFGVTLTASELSLGDMVNLANHTVFAGISKIYLVYTIQLSASPPASIIAWNLSGKGGVAAAECGSGRVVVVGDINFCENDYLLKSDNLAFSLNCFNWLSRHKVAMFENIVIDGKKDVFYSQLSNPDNGYLQLKSYAFNDNGIPAGDADLSARIWTAWDDKWFYLYEEVMDDTLSGNAANAWEEDCLELNFDPQPADSVANSVWQTRLTILGKSAAGVAASDTLNNVPDSLKQFARVKIDGGYAIELALRWPAVRYGAETVVPAAGTVFGLAISQHDNDGKARRQATVQWAAVLKDAAWNTPKYLGTARLLPGRKIQFIPKNNMTGVVNPVPYDGTPFYVRIDGKKDPFYNSLTGPGNGYLQLRSYAYNENGKPSNDADLSAKIWTAWDDSWFYLYEEVMDDKLSGNAQEAWDEDCLELNIDPQPSDSTVNSVWQTRLTALGKATVGVVAADSMNNVTAGQKQWVRTPIPGGYALELALKWSAILNGTKKISPAGGTVFGMAINQHDNDGAGHDATVQWAAVMSDQVWMTPKYLGTVRLLGDHKLQFTAKNNMTGRTNPIPYDGSDYTPTGIEETMSMDPAAFRLEQNYPNPFNPVTTICYSLSSPSEVRLVIYDVMGREMAVPVKGRQPAGEHRVMFDAGGLNSGMYLCRLKAGSGMITRKMLLLR